jgi:hypothetical protein
MDTQVQTATVAEDKAGTANDKNTTAKKIVDAVNKAKAKGKHGKKAAVAKKSGEPKTPRHTIDSVTVELLAKGPITLADLHKAVCKQFPQHDKDVLLNTTKRRLTGYLQSKGFKIAKNDDGKYRLLKKAS